MKRVKKEGVQVYAVAASPLLTIDQDHPVWKNIAMCPAAGGAYVRVQPPPGATGAEVFAVRDALLGMCARAVRVDARRQSKVVVNEAKPQPRAHKSARQVVEELLTEAATVDRDKLRAAAEAAMSKAGM